MTSLNERDSVELEHVDQPRPTPDSNGDVLNAASATGAANDGFTNDVGDDDTVRVDVKPPDVGNQIVTVSKTFVDFADA